MTVCFANCTLGNVVSITRHKNIIGISAVSFAGIIVGFYFWVIVSLFYVTFMKRFLVDLGYGRNHWRRIPL